MSQNRICDLDGRVINPSFDIFYTITSARDGVTKDICYFCAAAAGLDTWPSWTANTAKAVETSFRPTSGSTAWLYSVIVAGTTGATEPTWPLVEGEEFVDGTVTYRVMQSPTGNARVREALPGRPVEILSFWGWMSGSRQPGSFTTP